MLEGDRFDMSICVVRIGVFDITKFEPFKHRVAFKEVNHIQDAWPLESVLRDKAKMP